MREIAVARVRYGCRKIRVLLQREGFEVSKKVVYRVYREEGLSLRYGPEARDPSVRWQRRQPSLERRCRFVIN
jgi:hypothetical protein